MKSRIKILHLITNSCHYQYLYSVTDNADKSKFEISIGTLDPAGDLHDYYDKKGTLNFTLDLTSRKQYPQAVLKLARWLRKNQIDIIQTHLYDASAVGLMAAALARTPLAIFTGHHSQELISYRQEFNRKLPFWLDCLNSRWLSQYVIAPSEQMKESFIRFHGIPAERIAVVHHGFDFDNWKASDDGRERIRNEFKLEDKLVFGAVGRIYWIKDYPRLFSAFASVVKRFPNAVLMIAGASDNSELLSLAAKLSIERQIIFTGWRNDLPDLFSAMDVFVHSSLAESFGLAIVEAMAMGKPVICTEVGIAREIIEDGINGFLVPVGNEEKLTAAMEKIIQSRSKWDEMGATNRKRAEEFTAAKMVAGYEECYTKWLKARGFNQ